MVIDVDFKDRELLFKSGEFSGDGINELLQFISENSDKVQRVDFKGDSGSYTFSRQVYLLANLLSEISESSITINSREVKKGELVLPRYGK